MALKDVLRKWLQIQPATDQALFIREPSTYETNVIRNRIWYRGDPSELDQFFKQTANDEVTRARFWASSPSKGLRVRKIHSGLPGIIVDMLADIVTGDMLDVEFEEQASEAQKYWKEIAEENKFKALLTKAVQEVLVVGDGAFKMSLDPSISDYPLMDFYSGENVEYQYLRGRLMEVIFFSKYYHEKKEYILTERYGKGYIHYTLETVNGTQVPLNTVPLLDGLSNVTWDGDFLMAVPFKVYQSPKWANRGRSIFDLKADSFDALDETISQWQDAVRLGRIKRYIPSSMIPRDPETGKALPINPFDNQFTAISQQMNEGIVNQIQTEQPVIQYDGYINTYINNLDMCLQGIISPSTLGIDTKKIDNAEAQREKEKTTLYTRQKIVNVLQETVPELVKIALYTYALQHDEPLLKTDCMINFGEYANPSFEAQVETVGKASTHSVMSVRSQIETLWGDTRGKDWLDKEEERILQERGIMEFQEPTRVPHGFIEEDMIDGLGRLDNTDTDRDGNPHVRIDEEEPEETRARGDRAGLEVDSVAGDADAEPESDEERIHRTNRRNVR